MRTTLMIAIAATGLTACATAESEPYQMAADDREQLDEILDGRVAGEPQRCLFNSTNKQMTVIDDRTVLYRSGGRYYLQQFNNDCANLDSGSTALLTTNYGTTGPCEGELARVIDTSVGATYGACSFGPFIPYTNRDEDSALMDDATMDAGN